MAGTILIFLVDDDETVREILETALQDGGFAVATAAGAEEAILMLEAPDSAYRALVTDVHFPPSKVTGWDVARRARELHPELPVVYMTGAGGHEWAANGVPNSVLVMKPFAAAQVVTAVSQLLNAGNTSGV